MTAVYAIILFVLLIFPHELGHFLVAKAVGVKVNEFAFGMGPALFQKEKGETLYSIRLIPVGGYCAMEGENEESENPRSFNNKPGWAKISVLAAGAVMNVLIAILALSLLAGVVGTATTTIKDVEPGSPAYVAGLESGDKVVRVNETEIEEWNQIGSVIAETPDAITITVKRDGEIMTMNSVAAKKEEDRYIVGITTKISHSPIKALEVGTEATWNMTKILVRSLFMLISGDVPASDLAGPVGIVSMVNDTTNYGWYSFVSLIAMMSLNLAMLNLLPLPALDGGRILFVFIRKITGKMITDDMEGRVHGIGLMLLFAVLIFATWNDIVRLFT